MPIHNLVALCYRNRIYNPVEKLFQRGYGSIQPVTQLKSCKERKVITDPSCKVAVISGGSGGIAVATGRQLLCEKANHILLLGLDTAKGLEAVNSLNCSFGKNKCTFMKCDISKEKEIEDVLNKIKTEFKKVDIFINTAGVWNEAKWEEEMRVNLMGTINFNLAITKIFLHSHAVIINFAGIHGLQPFPPSPVFATEQAGIIQFSKTFGHPQTYKINGLRVLALCTGTTTCTDFLEGVEGKLLFPMMAPEYQRSLNESQKQKPEACAKAVVELIKYGATGSVWVVEGSRLVHLELPDWRKHRILVSQFI